MTIRATLYRKVLSGLVAPLVLPRLMSPARLADERERGIEATAFSPASADKTRIWYHAASAGELEALWTVIQASARQGQEVVVTAFSESAAPSLARLRETLSDMKDRILYIGYAPFEGRWRESLAKVRPSVFVTAKYEAWPELWVSLAEQGVPLVIVGAKARRSLRLGAAACKALGGKLPRLCLLASREADLAELKADFPEGEVLAAGEPRWDRVKERNTGGSPRAKELLARAAGQPRPWGILGQTWAQDLWILKEELASLPGTLWVVPHKNDEASIAATEYLLAQAGLNGVRTSRLTQTEPGLAGFEGKCWLVDEMGFLSELYAGADWVYVGGGFGAGVHSTIEPAIQGLPIACGPARTDKFPEIAELQASGQLTVIRTPDEAKRWLVSFAKPEGDSGDKARWREEARQRFGATRTILAILTRVAH